MSRGKADAEGTVRANRFHQTCRGIGDGMQAKGTRGNTGSPGGGCGSDQLTTRESQVGPYGVAERSVRPMKPGNAGGGKGPQFKTNAIRSEGPGDWATYQLRRVFRNCRWRCTRRRQKPAIASTSCTTRLAVRTSWRMPMPSAAPTRAHRVWMVKTLRTSRRMGCNGGLANWRLRSGRKLIDRTPSEECTYQRPMANSGRWASRPCVIESA